MAEPTPNSASSLWRRARSLSVAGSASLSLEMRAAYHLSGVARHEWEYLIVELDPPRYSINFRTFSARTELLAAEA